MSVVTYGILATGIAAEVIDLSLAQTGDILVVATSYPIATGTPAGGPADDTGWTERTNSASRPGITGATFSVWTKEYTSTPPASETFQNVVPGASTRDITVSYVLLRGVDYSTIDFPTHVTTSGTQMQLNHPSTTVAGSTVGPVLLFEFQSPESTSLSTASLPGGSSEWTLEQETDALDGSWHGYLVVRDDQPAGSTGALTMTFASQSTPRIGFTVSFSDDTPGEQTVSPTTGSLVVQGRALTANAFTNVRLREVLINEAGSPLANMSGLSLVIWYGGAPVGTPDLSYSAVTTDTNGTMSYSLATGSLIYNQAIFYVATDGSSSLSAWTCARAIPTYS